MQNTLRSPRERATEKLTTREVNFSWELAQPRLRQQLYEKGHQDFFIILLEHEPQKSLVAINSARPGTLEVNFSWELAQPRLRQWLYEKGHQDFFITLLSYAHCAASSAQSLRLRLHGPRLLGTCLQSLHQTL